MIKAKPAARIAAVLGVAAAAVACSSPPERAGAAEPVNSAPAQAVSGSLQQWQDAVCGDGNPVPDTDTRLTAGGSSCVPEDGDGAVNFEQFQSDSSMNAALSWAGSRYAAQTVVNNQPLVIWTPAGESSDLEPLKQFGFNIAPAGFVQQDPDSVPKAVTPSLPQPAAGAAPIPPNQYGYAVIQTSSGRLQCIVQKSFVGCQSAGSEWPASPAGDGPYHGVKINADGTAQWVDGNLGADSATTLGNQTYAVLGWTVTVSDNEIRFSNDATGHGAMVSEQRVGRF